MWLWKQALALRPELRRRFILTSSEPLPGPQVIAGFVEAAHFLPKLLSLATLCDEVQSVVEKAEEIRNEPQSA